MCDWFYGLERLMRSVGSGRQLIGKVSGGTELSASQSEREILFPLTSRASFAIPNCFDLSKLFNELSTVDRKRNQMGHEWERFQSRYPYPERRRFFVPFFLQSLSSWIITCTVKQSACERERNNTFGVFLSRLLLGVRLIWKGLNNFSPATFYLFFLWLVDVEWIFLMRIYKH